MSYRQCYKEHAEGRKWGCYLVVFLFSSDVVRRSENFLPPSPLEGKKKRKKICNTEEQGSPKHSQGHQASSYFVLLEDAAAGLPNHLHNIPPQTTETH